MAATKYGDDQALVSRQFRYENPEQTVENLHRTVPDQDKIPTIVGYYDEKPLGGRKENPDHPYVWCYHCQKPTHWKGFVVTDPDHKSFLIGQDCGKAHYGADFQIQQNSFRDLRSRQAALKSLEKIKELFELLQSEIQTAIHCDALKIVSLKRDELNRLANPVLVKLRKAIIADGQLSKSFSYRDTDAEAARIEKYNQAVDHYQSLPASERVELRDQGLKPEPPGHEPIYKKDIKPLGQIDGMYLISESSDPKSALFDLKSETGNVGKIIDKSEASSTRELGRKVKSFREKCKAVLDMAKQLQSYPYFFKPANIARLSEWSESDLCHGFEIRPEDSALIVTLSGQQGSRIEPMAKYSTPELTIIERLTKN